MLTGNGKIESYLSPGEIKQTLAEGMATLPVDGKRVLVIIPDGTRTMPMPLMFSLFQELMLPRLGQLDFLVALGTHQPMSDAQLTKLVGQSVVAGKVGVINIYNHHWEDPANFEQLGTIPASEIQELTEGLFAQDVPVALNRMILNYDHLIVCGPVFPHEVVGFSGGNKYFFPGIAGPDIINFTHWLGAVITNVRIIGAGYTPVRAVIDRAAGFIDLPRTCIALVVSYEGTSGIYIGTPEEAWLAGSRLSAQKHIIYVDKPFKRVLSIMPDLYDDLWTAAKGTYKMEPAIADGGEVVIYAPRITEVSYTHGKILDEIGYHTRDYFRKQWEHFSHYPGGVLAHSTHVKGAGTYDPNKGIETPRIHVTLATGIPPERCRRINLGYLNPASIRLEEWQDRVEEGILVVPRAGEMLYRLRSY
jgi:nickel-dependent lactate racemase